MAKPFSIDEVEEFRKTAERLLYLKREDFGSVKHRKELANLFGLDEQKVIDLPKSEFSTLVIGLNKGKTLGVYISTEEIKSSFFCVDIDIWNHRKADFEKILKEVVEEMKKADEEKKP